MVTNLETNYVYEDGIAYTLEETKDVKEGDKLKVYVPFLTPDIPKPTAPAFMPEGVAAGSQTFCNVTGMPVSSGSVTKINYIEAKVSSSLIIRKSNDALIERSKLMKAMGKSKLERAIEYIPIEELIFKAGIEVYACSDNDSILDLYLT